MAREHEDYRESVAAYVLGALPELETTAFERHLESCAACHAELQALAPTVDALGRGVPPVSPRPKLRRIVMSAVRHEAGAGARRPAARPRLRGAGFLPLRPAVAAGLASALLAVGVAVGYLANSSGGGDGERTVAANVDRSRAPAARASLDVGEGDAGAVLRVVRMPQPGPGRVYQVWLKRNGQVTPGSLFEVRRDGTGAAAVPEGVKGVDAVLVTREPRGGSAAPSEAPLVRVRL